jgi:hypothetical protein
MTPLELTKKFCQSIGLASLILVVNYGDLLGGGSDVRMHVPFPLTGIVLAQLADIFLLGLLIFVILVAVKRTRFYNWLRLLIAIVIPPYLIERLRTQLPFAFENGLFLVLAIAWAGLLLLLLLKFPRRYRALTRTGDAIGIFFAFFALCSICQLLYVLRWHPGPHQHTVAWATTPQPPRNHPLLVWVVFDELSYDQLFEHRAHTLELPNFDALRVQSTLFTNVQPIGSRTVKIIPSLLSGHIVTDFRFAFDNTLKVHDEGGHGFHPLTGQDTVFHDAQQAGWRTSAVGWYNPYCTLYAGAIDDCYWMNLDRIDGDMAQENSFWRNTYAPLQQVVREIKAPARADRDSCTFDVRQRFQTHIDLQKHSLQVLHTDQADMVFLHLPIPHSPNIWSRIEDNYIQFCDSSYLDNLALADHVLGRIMSELQSSPRWSETTVIVQGDHGWRTPIWDWLPAWTDEDDLASRDTFDPRPALLIHQPGQTTPATVSAPWSLLNVHNVIEQTLHHQPTKY